MAAPHAAGAADSEPGQAPSVVSASSLPAVGKTARESEKTIAAPLSAREEILLGIAARPVFGAALWDTTKVKTT